MKMGIARAGRGLCWVAVGAMWVSAAAAQSAPDVCRAKPCVYLDPKAETEARVKDLVGRMTLDEKVSQMQDVAVAIPRLGVPGYNWWNEALHGVARRGVATVFPQAIGLAATWDRQMLREVGETISTEARANFNESPTTDKKRYAGLTFWSPNVNIFRDPRWGRGQETYGEDPYLTGQLAIEFVKGVQGDDPHYFKAIATPKHYAVHSGPESLRHRFNVDVSAHDLEDTYLPAFRAAIVEAHADSIMCAYNAIDGAPACASKMLLQEHLVKAWGFRGYVVSDCDAVGDVAGGHHYAKDTAEASAVSVKAGTDLDCGAAYKALPDAVKRGLITEPEIDAALGRLMTARMKLGMFDPPAMVPWSTIPASENDSEAHRLLAKKAALESIVLLKNDGVLPLKPSVKTIAVIGPTAESVEVMQGNYNGSASHPVFAREGFAQRFGAEKVLYAPGAVLAPGFLAAIPGTALHPEPGSNKGGLKAEYFNSGQMTGAAAATRVDANIHFDWRHAAPMPGVPADVFGVRWSGVLMAPMAGQYTLALSGIKNAPEASGRVRFYLDGALVPSVSGHSDQAVITLSDVKPHAIRVEYVRSKDDGSVTLQWQLPNAALIADALSIARQADVVFAFVGLSPQLEGEEMNVHIPGFDGGDKTDINLPATQQAMLEALKRTGKPLVVVLNSGSAVAMPWAEAQANAIFEEWYPGEEGGDAIAALAAGDASPSGRLPVTFYRSVDDLPSFTQYAMQNRTYRYYKGKVLYPFGYGLSYVSFAYADATVEARELKAGETQVAHVSVKNGGAQAADEVLEAYLQGPKTNLSPGLFLCGFTRVHLAAGETRTVDLPIDARRMSTVDAAGKRSVLPGTYTLSLGGGQPGSGAGAASVVFTVQGSVQLPE